MRDRLPEGWTIAPLGEITEINPRHPKGIDDSMPVAFAPMAAISESKPEFQFLEERPLGKVRKGFTHFAEGDVLFAKITPCMENGKGAVAVGLRNGLGCGTTELHVLRPQERIDPYYLYRFLAQPSIRRMAKEKFTGTAGQARVPTSFIDQLGIPLPPLPEQRRIVAKLEKLLAKVDTCQNGLAKIPVLIKRFRQSVLAAACAGRLTADWRPSNPTMTHEKALLDKTLEVEDLADVSGLEGLPLSWKLVRVKDVAQVQGGIQKQPKRIPRKNAYPYLRVANVLRGRLDLTEVLKMELFDGELETYRLVPMDLLIVEGNGSLREIGRSALWTGEIKDCVHQNHIIRVRAKLCLPKYLNIYWNSPIGIERVVGQAVTTAGLYSLSTKKIASSLVPIPPLPEQQEIVRRVGQLFVLADQIEAHCARAKAHADTLTQSILAKAFRGELVSADGAPSH